MYDALTQQSRWWQRIFGGWFSLRNDLAELEAEVPQILPVRYFELELEREILRSDRTHSPLTVLLFDIENRRLEAELRARRLKQLARVIHECSRRVDCKGWHQDQQGLRVGLILHSTEASRTGRLITKIREQFEVALRSENGHGKFGREIVCEILSYPHQYGSGRGDFRDDSTDGNPDLLRESAFRAPAPITLGPAACTSQLIARPLPLWKLALDKSVALTMILLAAPVLLATAILIKLTSPGPVIYRQRRVGFQQRQFELFKFRSMRVNNKQEVGRHARHLRDLIDEDEDKPMVKLDKHNPDITLVGRVIRATYIDELPQLFNVLSGDMSLVGPRPCLPHEAEQYRIWNTRRFDIVPGMTGLWQVSGKNKLTFSQMIRHDINYARQCSLWLDLKILLRTIPMIIEEVREKLEQRKRGARQAEAGVSG